MAINEIRESIVSRGITTVEHLVPTVIQRKINLTALKRHTINFLDFMDDSMVSLNPLEAYEFTVSIYPVAPTEMIFAETFQDGAPDAADDNILFKAYGVGTPAGQFITSEFPNQFLGSSPTFDFYSPHIYLTLILHNATGSPITISDARVSTYIAVEEEEVDETEFMMGMYSEYLHAQFKNKLSVGNNVQSTAGGIAGYSFPTWRFGGIRPSRMLRGASGVLSQFWLPGFGQDGESMMTHDNLGEFFDDSRQMQTFDQAWGRESAKGGVPDWLNFSFIVGAVTEVRTNFPPRVTQDDPTAVGLGNVVCV